MAFAAAKLIREKKDNLKELKKRSIASSCYSSVLKVYFAFTPIQGFPKICKFKLFIEKWIDVI